MRRLRVRRQLPTTRQLRVMPQLRLPFAGLAG
jgi:hypothetical protein